MLQEFGAVLIQAVIAVGFAGVTLLLSVMFGRSAARNPMKDSAYECGMLPVGAGQPRFSVKFYMVAMLFVIFDVEVVFMYPWAVVFRRMIVESPMVFWSMFSFAGILVFAFVYAWRKGALTWN
jgi:NADH-quinone oxidoreductase subunit A